MLIGRVSFGNGVVKELHKNSTLDWCVWLKDNKSHREDGPAVEYSNGHKEWYQNDMLHRLNGPAVEYADGRQEWYVDGEMVACYTQEEFERLIKLMALW